MMRRPSTLRLSSILVPVSVLAWTTEPCKPGPHVGPGSPPGAAE